MRVRPWCRSDDTTQARAGTRAEDAAGGEILDLVMRQIHLCDGAAVHNLVQVRMELRVGLHSGHVVQEIRVREHPTAPGNDQAPLRVEGKFGRH